MARRQLATRSDAWSTASWILPRCVRHAKRRLSDMSSWRRCSRAGSGGLVHGIRGGVTVPTPTRRYLARQHPRTDIARPKSAPKSLGPTYDRGVYLHLQRQLDDLPPPPPPPLAPLRTHTTVRPHLKAHPSSHTTTLCIVSVVECQLHPLIQPPPSPAHRRRGGARRRGGGGRSGQGGAAPPWPPCSGA
jgi:hypothetical protein